MPFYRQRKDCFSLDSFSKVVEMVKEYCSDHPRISSIGFNKWINILEPVKLENGVASLYTESDFSRTTTIDAYGDILKDAFTNILGFDVEVNILVKPEAEEQGEQLRAAQEVRPSGEIGKKELTFDNFIRGKSNDLAYTCCTAVANVEKSGNQNFINPLFIYGNSGLGKTHLLMAIKNEILKKRPDFNIIYITGEQFTNEYIKAISDKDTVSFHEKYRQADFLLIDDVQFIAGKDSTQEEFFHTFNELYNRGKQIVLTSDIQPSKMARLEERLQSRFVTGMQVDIQSPDFETRLAIIKRKADDLNFTLHESVTKFIAEKIKTNIRQLEGAVNKMKALTLYTSEAPSLSMAQRIVKEIQIDNKPAEITVDRIINDIAVAFNVSAEDIRSKNRSAPISLARKVAIYIFREVKGMTYLEIGNELGRDHSTMTTSYKDVNSMMKKNPDLKNTISDIIKNLKVN